MQDKKAFTLIELIVIVSIIAILSLLIIPNILKARSASSEAVTKKALRSLSTAAETFSLTTGNYPSYETDLNHSTPPYLNAAYCGSTISGYNYACTFGTGGYTIVATPIEGGASGTVTFTMTTGGVLSP